MMKLQELAEKMETMLRETEDELMHIGDNFVRNIKPWQCRDSQGRFILLDMYAAYGQVRAALVHEENAQQKAVSAEKDRPHPPHEDDEPNRGFVFRQGDATWLRNFLAKYVVLADRPEFSEAATESAIRIVNELDRMPH